MTSPFTPALPQDAQQDDRDFIPFKRCRNKLLIVRPLTYQQQGFVTKHKPEGTDVVFCDVACLDDIPAAVNEMGEQLKGFQAGHQFRNQAVQPGYLKGTFKRMLGQTLIGTIYFGPVTKGLPPIMWHDLAGDAGAVARGAAWLQQHPDFLVPFTPAVPEVAPQAAQWAAPAAPAYAPAAAPQYGAPVSAPPQYAPAAPVQAAPLTTLDSMRAQLASVNHQGMPQPADAPF